MDKCPKCDAPWETVAEKLQPTCECAEIAALQMDIRRKTNALAQLQRMHREITGKNYHF